VYPYEFSAARSLKYWITSASEYGPGIFSGSRRRKRSGMLENNSSIDFAPMAASISCRSAGLFGR
jgi:hypothetical protein